MFNHIVLERLQIKKYCCQVIQDKAYTFLLNSPVTEINFKPFLQMTQQIALL